MIGLTVLWVLCWVHAAVAGTHSLSSLRVVTIDGTELSEHMAVGMVDDVKYYSFNSTAGKLVPLFDWVNTTQGRAFWERTSWHHLLGHDVFKWSVRNLVQHFNRTGVHIFQHVGRCELDDDGTKRGQLYQAYDGRDFVSFDVDTMSWVAAVPQAVVYKHKRETDTLSQQIYSDYYRQQCFELLKTFLQNGKETLLRKGSAHRYHPCTDCGVKTNTRCPPNRVPSAARIFTRCRLTMQPPRGTVLEDNAALGSVQASPQAPGQTTGVAVPPEVSVIQRMAPRSAGTEVLCHVTGFYPREVDVSWVRDGEAVLEEGVWSGEVLPNGDGTYQLTQTVTHVGRCELDDDGTKRGQLYQAYDGRDFVSFDVDTMSWVAAVPQAVVYKHKRETDTLSQQIYSDYYRQQCFELLKTFLQNGKETLLRKGSAHRYHPCTDCGVKTNTRCPPNRVPSAARIFTRCRLTMQPPRVPPEVSVIQRMAPRSAGTEVLCHVTGFYPREVDVSWVRDGEAVLEEGVWSGEVLPNGDGTYQLTQTVTVSAEDREKHSYSCQVDHSSLEDAMNVKWVPQADRHTWLVAVGVLAAALPLIAVFIGVVTWKKRTAVHTYQHVSHCELDDDGTKRAQVYQAYDGRDFVSLDVDTMTWVAAVHQAVIYKHKRETNPDSQQIYFQYFRKYGFELLMIYLQYGNETLQRKVHTYQHVSHCELDDDGTKRAQVYQAYDGRDFVSLDVDTMTWVAAVHQAVIYKHKRETNPDSQQIYFQYFRKYGFELLMIYLQYGNETLQRKVRPEVSVIQRMAPRSAGTEVLCHVTGFYPREVDVSWVRDGEAVLEEGVWSGEVLPNGDGTYQLTQTVTVSAEDREKHSYSCQVDHSSLEETKNVKWVPQADRHTWLVAVGVLAAALPLIAVFIGVVTWKKRIAGKLC
ncbi:UNVERIFIED_CONTAM: hypothetical protein FKN15_043833 [Acipenser sinensis]